MGGLCSIDAEARDLQKRNAAIEKQLEEDRKFRRREVKILLLGAGESGKSTIFRQMKIIHQDGYSREELLLMKDAIFGNVLLTAHQICDAMTNLKVAYATDSAKVAAAAITGIPALSRLEPADFQQILVPNLKIILRDSGIQDVIDRSREYYLLDSAPYYWDNLDRLAQVDYVPNEQDVLRARVKTTGISETRFNMGQLHIHMFDVGGQRSERKKWIHCFENVTSIIFCVALSGYCQQLVEDSSQNRMLESLLLFESVVNTKWFTRSSIILFLNMTDLFKQKLHKCPLNKYFPSYTGGENFNKAAEFILGRFAELNHAKLNVYPHLTCATDTNNIKFVFAALKETILQNSLKDAGLL